MTTTSPTHPLTREQRADLVTARETIRLALAGADHADLGAAAAGIDRVLAGTCPHDPATWETAPDAAGRQLTTCRRCNVSWFAGEGRR